MQPVADHHASGGGQVFLPQDMRDQVRLAIQRAAGFAAVNAQEAGGEAEMFDDAGGKVPPFRGGEHQVVAGLIQRFQRRSDARIERGIIQPGQPVMLAVEGDAVVDAVVAELRHQPGPNLRQGRPDRPGQVPGGIRVMPQFAQGGVDAADDARAGIGQRAIQVQQNDISH